MPRAPSKTPSRVARVLLRLPPDVHHALATAAAAAGLSFNEFCVRRLRAPAHPDDPSVVRSLVVDRARAAIGDHLLGVVVLGSWARGRAATNSDIDVLIVIDPEAPLTREIYRTWDRTPLSFDGRAIDAHFVHPSARGTAPTSLWCEAAVDGLVWYDRDGCLTRRLAEVRRDIAEGRVVRACAHGQPYWKGAA
jgi:predicted nucleotidyltransferase